MTEITAQKRSTCIKLTGEEQEVVRKMNQMSADVERRSVEDTHGERAC
jgi:hypothetical protein